MLEKVTEEKKATEAFVILKISNKKVKAGVEVNVVPLRIYNEIKIEDGRWERLRQNYVDMKEPIFQW